MMYVKLMSGENLPDNDPRKSFELLSAVKSIVFNRYSEAPAPAGPTAFVTFVGDRTWPIALAGNVYVMNSDGKTIEKFFVQQPGPPPPPGEPK